MHQKILILDFGSQYTQLIARRVREASVYCELHPYDVSDAVHPRVQRRQGIILSGGPASVYEEETPRAPESCSIWACRCSASATACRPWRRNWAARWKTAVKREFGYAEVRAQRPFRAAARHPGPRQRGRPRPARRVDEPRRQGDGAAARFQGDRLQRGHADRRHGRRSAPDFTACSSTRK